MDTKIDWEPSDGIMDADLQRIEKNEVTLASNRPSASIIPPKTNWREGDALAAVDLNRIEQNIATFGTFDETTRVNAINAINTTFGSEVLPQDATWDDIVIQLSTISLKANQIKIDDPHGVFTATNVEDALYELFVEINGNRAKLIASENSIVDLIY